MLLKYSVKLRVHVQAMAANLEGQAQHRVQAMEQQAQAMVSELSNEVSRPLAVANGTLLASSRSCVVGLRIAVHGCGNENGFH